MPTQIEELRKLQDLDLEITGIRSKIDEQPRKLGEQKGTLHQAGQQVDDKKKEIMETQKNLDSLEVDLQEGEEKIQKLKLLLNAAKTNDEYSVLKRSIADQERKNSKVEEEILGLMAKSDDLRDELAALKDERGRSEETLKSFEAEAERDSQALKGTLDEHLSRREELASAISAEAVRQYERIFVQRQDGAIAQVSGKVCQGCFMTVPSQWINLLQINRDIVTCPSCGRILYL